ncbi:disease resistance protein RPM1-like [Prunus dulcis]|uniref:disease resistance protein RPM1-like n=1 Tax=Prunus dulcis TaxID=3755 RepID=UPI0014823D1E|nr:disease resistance protein RPM1-like [Prunus dulcis]
MASATTDLLIGKIVGILENEASAIAGFGDQVDEIKQELLYMKSFLQDAEGKEPHTEGEKTWVTMVRNLTFKAEVIIDKFMYDMYEQQSQGRFARWLQKPIHIPKILWYRRQVAIELQKITRTIKAIPERNQRYCVGSLSSSSNDNHKWVKNQADQSSLFIEEDELVGIERKKHTLMERLMSEERHQMVVSVVGMGGSGKTTLVAKTFTDETIKRYFDCYAWITVSQTYVIEDLFRSLIKEFHRSRKEEVPPSMSSLEHTELVEMLRNYLDAKRYLVVLDDVWDIKLWERVRISLPDSRALGNRILLTTRNQEIALYPFGVESHVYRIELLEKDEAWELFNKKAFSTYHEHCCPPEFESLASELVEKCEGLPLAIVALSGVLASKESPTEWIKVYSSLNWQLTNNPLLKPMTTILLLSFDDLPYQLKHCFMYCSLFPEDYLIDGERLIRLWLAEGFVEQVDGLTPEEVAENYLIELIRRSMLKVEDRTDMGKALAYKMHDILRELALSMSQKENFSANYVGREMRKGTARRLSIQTTEGEISSIKGLSELRSFLVFVTSTFSLPSRSKLLKVLDLEKVPMDKLPSGLVYLFNLRYLNLRGTSIKELPKFIGRLGNLETLDISHTKIEVLPRGISKLLNLRHLLMYHHTWDDVGFKYLKGTRVPSNISELKKLQVLEKVESDGNIAGLIGSMTQLRQLGITNVKGSDEMDLCDSIQKMKQLRNLSLTSTDADEFLKVDKQSSPPPHLEIVSLAGKLHKVPVWFCSLQSLTHLHLHWAKLENDELLPQIEALPCLASLDLFNAYNGKELYFGGGFPKLTRLVLSNLLFLSKITIEKGVMPNLKSLFLNSCIELKTLPLGIEYLLNLNTLELVYLPTQLVDSIREGGVDRPKVQHIPKIHNYYTTSSGTTYYESLSYT